MQLPLEPKKLHTTFFFHFCSSNPLKVCYISFESQNISTFPSLLALWFHHHHQLTHHHPLYVDLQFQLLDRLSGICNLGHVVGHPALFPPMSASLQHTSFRRTRDNSAHHRSRRKKHKHGCTSISKVHTHTANTA